MSSDGTRGYRGNSSGTYVSPRCPPGRVGLAIWEVEVQNLELGIPKSSPWDRVIISIYTVAPMVFSQSDISFGSTGDFL